MTRRRTQRRLCRYIDHPAGPTWRDLDDARLWDDPQWSPSKPAVPPRPPYEQMPQRPPIPVPRKDAT